MTSVFEEIREDIIDQIAPWKIPLVDLSPSSRAKSNPKTGTAEDHLRSERNRRHREEQMREQELENIKRRKEELQQREEDLENRYAELKTSELYVQKSASENKKRSPNK